MFQNFHQVPLGEENVVFIELTPAEEYVEEFHVTLPNQEGVNQLQFISVYDPYQPLLNGNVMSPLVEASFRLAVETAAQTP